MKRPPLTGLIATASMAVILFSLPVLIRGEHPTGGRVLPPAPKRPPVETVGPAGLPAYAEAVALRKLELARRGLLATPADVERGARMSPDSQFPGLLVLDAPVSTSVPYTQKLQPKPTAPPVIGHRPPGREGLTQAELEKLEQHILPRDREEK